MANARRANIPLYRQTDPKYFPDYEFREYPKEMKDENGDSIIVNPIYLMTTPRDPEATPKEVLRNGKRIVIGGDPTIVNNREEEDEFYRQHPEMKKAAQERAKIISFPIGDPAAAAALEAENARMTALLEENARLKSLLNAPDAAPARKKPGPKPKAKAPEPQAESELPADLK